MRRGKTRPRAILMVQDVRRKCSAAAAAAAAATVACTFTRAGRLAELADTITSRDEVLSIARKKGTRPRLDPRDLSLGARAAAIFFSPRQRHGKKVRCNKPGQRGEHPYCIRDLIDVSTRACSAARVATLNISLSRSQREFRRRVTYLRPIMKYPSDYFSRR